MRSARPLTFALLLGALSLSASCGGGTTNGDAGCTVPGILRALAVQGQPAPETSGNFGIFGVAAQMDVAPNGWAVFVAPTTDPLRTTALYVALPNGTLRLVWAVGDPVPDAGGGTISGFSSHPLRVTSDGKILVGVNIQGDSGGRTFGLLSARVQGASVVERNDVIYHLRDMTPTGVSGVLTTMQGLLSHLADDGKVFFTADTNTGQRAMWRIDLDGTDLEKVVAEGEALPGGLTIAAIDQTGIDTLGTRFSFVAQVVGTLDEGVYSGTPGSGTYSELAFEGDPLTAGTLADPWVAGPLLTYASGSVVWHGRGSFPSPDDVILLGGVGLPFLEMARSDGVAPGTGGNLGTLGMLNVAPDGIAPMFRAAVLGSPGTDFALYSAELAGLPTLVTFEGQNAPSSAGGGTFTDVYPGLSQPGREEVSRDGSIVFANQLSTGATGLFWLVRGCGLFALAASGTGAPGGDTFGSFGGNSGHVTADGVVLFRAALDTAGSGMFRQGP